MSNLNIGDPTDFARLVVSPLAGLINSLTGGDPQKWDIVEASFISEASRQKNPAAKPVKFLIFETVESYQAGLSTISDVGGRRKVKFQYPYIDGQTTDDLGKRPEEYDIQVIFHGTGYKAGLLAFLNEVNQPTPGTLRHPVRGDLPCCIEDYEITHTHDSRKAAIVRVKFIEHTFTIDNNAQFAGPKAQNSIKSALLAALSALKAINTVINKVQAVIFKARTLQHTITQALAEYQFAFTRNLQSLNVTFNPGSFADLPALLPVNFGGTTNANGQTVTDTFTVAASPNDPFLGIVTADSTLIQAIATTQAIQLTNALRDQVAAIILQLASVDGGQGALTFRDEILSLKTGVIAMQQVLETGIASSTAKIVSFTTPRPMSVREVAFAVGLDVQRCYDIVLLNPTLLSTNWIEVGTVLQVPT